MERTTDDNVRELIELRMREYDSLRSEVVQRIAARNQVAGYAGLAGFIAAMFGNGIGLWTLLAIILIVVIAYLFLLDSNDGIQRIGEHLRTLEKEVNALSQQTYQCDALTWETKRQQMRNRQPKVWKRVGRIGGWHRDEPELGLPDQRSGPTLDPPAPRS